MAKLKQKLSLNHPLLQGKLLGKDTQDLLSNLESGALIDSDVLSMIAASYEHPKMKEVVSLESLNTIFVGARKSLDVEVMKLCINLLNQYSEKFGEIQEDIFVRSFMKENAIDKIDDSFHGLSEDMKLLVAKQFAKEGKYNFGCGGSFGYYKTPTGCGSCISGKESLELAGLDHLAVFRGDRQYSIPKQRIIQAQNTILSSHGELGDQEKENLDKIYEIYRKQLYVCEDIIKNKLAIEKIQETNPSLSDKFIVDNLSDFLLHIQDIKYPAHIIVDIRHKVVAYLEGTSRYYGSGGSEYGNYIALWYNGKREAKHVVYRDAYSPSKDDWSLNFNKISIDDIQIHDANITITVTGSSDTNKRSLTSTLPLAQNEPGLSKEEQDTFEKLFVEKKNEILLAEKSFSDGKTMPVYCLPSDMQRQGMPNTDVNYLTPQIQSEAINKMMGVGYVVIHCQIDHGAGHKRQLAWKGYRINADGTYSRDFYETMRDAERLAGKQVRVTAQDLLG